MHVHMYAVTQALHSVLRIPAIARGIVRPVCAGSQDAEIEEVIEDDQPTHAPHVATRPSATLQPKPPPGQPAVKDKSSSRTSRASSSSKPSSTTPSAVPSIAISASARGSGARPSSIASAQINTGKGQRTNSSTEKPALVTLTPTTTTVIASVFQHHGDTDEVDEEDIQNTSTGSYEIPEDVVSN